MDRSQENDQQQKSSVDRVNDIINNARDLQNKYKNLKKDYKAYKRTRTAATAVRTGVSLAQAGAATASSSSSGAIITAGGIFLLFLIIFIIIIVILIGAPKNNSCENSGGTCGPASACASPGTVDPSLSCSSGAATDVCCISNADLECGDIGGVCYSGEECPLGTNKNTAGCKDDPARPLCCTPPSPCTKQLKFYCQYDRRKYSNCNVIHYRDGTCYNNNCNGITTCDIVSNGCTPTSVAMVLASFGDTEWNPRNTALVNGGAGCLCGGSGFNRDFSSWVRTQGYTIGQTLVVQGMPFKAARAKSLIDAGYIIIAAADIRYNRSQNKHGAHAFVITDIDTSGNATVYDPTWCSSDEEFTVRHFNVFSTGGRPIYNWFNAYPVIKNSCLRN